jgi:hypothetical protein
MRKALGVWLLSLLLVGILRDCEIARALAKATGRCKWRQADFCGIRTRGANCMA